MRIAFLCLVMLVWGQWLSGQVDTSYQLLSAWPVHAVDFTTDEFGRIYTRDAQNKLTRYTPDGQPDFFYANNSLGALEQVDARDPFNLLLYYPFLQTIQLLDRTLNPTRDLKLMDLNLWAVPAVALAEDGQIWLFDDVSMTLQKRSSTDGTLLNQSLAINWLLRAEVVVRQLLVYDQSVYVLTQDHGVLHFDPFGQFVGPLELHTADILSVQFLEGMLVYETAGGYFGYSLAAKKVQPVPLPGFDFEPVRVRWEGSRLYVLGAGQMRVFQLRE